MYYNHERLGTGKGIIRELKDMEMTRETGEERYLAPAAKSICESSLHTLPPLIEPSRLDSRVNTHSTLKPKWRIRNTRKRKWADSTLGGGINAHDQQRLLELVVPAGTHARSTQALLEVEARAIRP